MKHILVICKDISQAKNSFNIFKDGDSWDYASYLDLRLEKKDIKQMLFNTGKSLSIEYLSGRMFDEIHGLHFIEDIDVWKYAKQRIKEKYEYPIQQYGRVIRVHRNQIDLCLVKVSLFKRIYFKLFKPKGYIEKYKRVMSKKILRSFQVTFNKNMKKRIDEKLFETI